MNVVRGIRRTSIVAIVVSLVIAAIVGIIALLSGEFGETQSQVLLTTLTFAAFGTTALCHLAVVARAVRVVGFAGIAASAAAAVCAFVLIWGDEQRGGEWQEPWLKTLAVLAILAVSLAQANLLLLLAARPQPVIRVALGVTLVAIAVVAVMVWMPILTDGDIPGVHGETYWRWFGVIAILDALGTIALPILGLVLRRADPRESSDLLLALDPGLRARLDARAAVEGKTSEALVRGLIENDLDAAGP